MFICVLMIGFIGCFVWSIFKATAVAIVQLRRMHQVPCDRCVYFANSSYLKCTVHPCRALTEEAIDCRDFEAQQVPRRAVWQDTWIAEQAKSLGLQPSPAQNRLQLK